MTKMQGESIATRATQLAVDYMDVADRQDYTGDPYVDCYEEYLDQLMTGDYQNLRQWIGWEIEEGNREAVEIQKMIIRAGLQSVA